MVVNKKMFERIIGDTDEFDNEILNKSKEYGLVILQKLHFKDGYAQIELFSTAKGLYITQHNSALYEHKKICKPTDLEGALITGIVFVKVNPKKREFVVKKSLITEEMRKLIQRLIIQV